MATLIARPTVIKYYQNAGGFWDGAVDGNSSSGSSCSTLYGSGTGYAFYGGFDFSALPDNVVINAVSAFVKAGSTDVVEAFSMRLTKDYSGATTYTDLGDGAQAFVSNVKLSTLTYYAVSFPVASAAVTVPFLKGGNLVPRLYFSVDTLTNKLTLYDLYIEIDYTPRITVDTKVSPENGGTVTGGGVYKSGSTVTLTATPNRGYAFSHWQFGETTVSAENPISGPLIADVTLTAVFVKNETSKIYVGTKKCSVYVGTQKCSVYAGTKKLS